MTPSQLTQDQRGGAVARYLSGDGTTQIAKDLGVRRSALKEFFRRRGILRTQSVAAQIAWQRGRKDKWIQAGLYATTVTHRYNPGKTPWRGDPTKHPGWKKDRTQLKKERGRTEERMFMQEAITRVDYTCQLTGKRGGKLSVHHIDPVWRCPERRYDHDNVIVINKDIHKHFHHTRGLKTTAEAWHQYVKEGEYLAVCQ
jgi:hypothetical protein